MHLLTGGERVGTAQNQVRRSIYSLFPGDPYIISKYEFHLLANKGP